MIGSMSLKPILCILSLLSQFISIASLTKLKNVHIESIERVKNDNNSLFASNLSCKSVLTRAEIFLSV